MTGRLNKKQLTTIHGVKVEVVHLSETLQDILLVSHYRLDTSDNLFLFLRIQLRDTAKKNY